MDLTQIKRKKWKKSIGGWILGLGIFILILYWLGFQDIIQVITELSIPIFLFCVFVYCTSWGIRTIKWKIILNNYPYSEVLKIFLISKTVGIFMPSRLGELAPLAMKKYRNRDIASLIFLDRVLETYATLLLGGLGVIMIGYYTVNALVAWIIIFSLLTGLFSLSLNKEFFQKRYQKTKNKKFKKVLSLLKKLTESMNTHKKHLVPLTIISLIATFLDFTFISLIFRSMDYTISLPLVAAAWLISGLTTIISFTPGGLGIADAPPAYLFKMFSVPSPKIGALFVISRTVNVLIISTSLLILLKLKPSITSENRK